MTISLTDFSQFDQQWILDRVKVDDAESGCWQWQGVINEVGRAKYSNALAYRISYTVFAGPIPDGLQINHHCDNPGCVRPSHLYAGTHKQNTADMWRRGRANPKGPRGERQHIAHSDALVAKVRKEVSSGQITKAVAAQRYGVGVSTIRQWIRGSRVELDAIAARDERYKPRPACGTRAAYYRHRKAGEPRCDPCWEANRLYMIAWKAKRAQGKPDEWLGGASERSAA